jgi:hypothetical protein
VSGALEDRVAIVTASSASTLAFVDGGTHINGARWTPDLGE